MLGTENELKWAEKTKTKHKSILQKMSTTHQV